MSATFIQASAAFFITLLAIVALARVAPKVGLVDMPDERKSHDGSTPLVGGLAIFTALISGAILWGGNDPAIITVRGQDAMWVFMVCVALLVGIGAIDDRLHLGVFIRLCAEVFVAFLAIEALNLQASHLGDLLGLGAITLPTVAAYPFTVIAIFGVMNAFNMLDGLDGSLGSLVLTTIIIFHLLTGTAPSLITLFISCSLVAFLVSNLNLSPHIPKTFLGDAGSKLLGFIVVCLLLAAASKQLGAVKLIQPVTALFLVALPLYDMVFTSVRRLIRQGSPLLADRSHIHHLLLKLGFSDRRALFMILSIHSSLTGLGLLLHRANAPDHYQFAIFLLLFSLYTILTSQLWLLVRES